MNFIKTILVALIYLSVVSCERVEMPRELDNFQVTTEKQVYKVNEAVNFEITGNPDMVSFFSGEIYNDYDQRGTSRKIDLLKTFVSFSHAYPTLAGSQTSDFKILVSTDFNNTYTYENVTDPAADWIDITSKFTAATSGTYIESGKYQISDNYKPGKPLYFAFRYTSKPQEGLGLIRRRVIQNFQMLAESEFDEHIIGDMNTTDFYLIEKDDAYKTKSTLTATLLTFDGYNRSLPTDPDPDTDTWFVSKPFDLDTLDNGPDRPIPVKGNQDPELRQYSHTFSKPGEYTVTFVGINANVSGRKEVIRQIKIKVEQ